MTVVVAVYGLYRTYQDRKIYKREMVHATARVAVRVTEANFVRPLLKDRMKTCIEDFAHHHPDFTPYQTRMFLFCELQESVRLEEDEKSMARRRAFNVFVDLLRIQGRHILAPG